MKEAGAGLFDAVRRLVPTPRSGDIVIVCGKGNNGGDGFAVASCCLTRDTRSCAMPCAGPTIAGEQSSPTNRMPAARAIFLFSTTWRTWATFKSSLIIDALLGTGLKGDPRGFHAEVIEAINNANVPVLSVTRHRPGQRQGSAGQTLHQGSGDAHHGLSQNRILFFSRTHQCWNSLHKRPWIPSTHC